MIKCSVKNYSLWILILMGVVGCRSYCPNPDHLPQKNHDPVRAWAFFYQGLALEKRECWKDAAQKFYLAAAYDRRSPRIYLHLAKNLRVLHLNEKALCYVKKTEELASRDDYLIYYDMGTLYLDLDRPLQAKKCLQHCISIFPKFSKAHRVLKKIPKTSQ